MGDLFKRPTFTRQISGIERGPDVSYPVFGTPTVRLGNDLPPELIPNVETQTSRGQLMPVTRTASYKGMSPGLAALADFATAFGGPHGFGSGIPFAAQNQERRRAAQEKFFQTEQQQADVASQRALQLAQIERQQEQDNAPIIKIDEDTGRVIIVHPRKIQAGDIAGGVRTIDTIKKITPQEAQAAIKELQEFYKFKLSPVQIASLAATTDNPKRFAAELSKIRAEVERDKQAEEKAAALVTAQAERDKKANELLDKRFTQMLTLQSRAFAQMDKRDTAKRTLDKPPTATEQRVFNFFNRALDAEKTIRTVEEDVAKMGLAGQTALNFAPNFLQSQTGQLYRQATQQFTEARLRKESGAAIAQSEYENDRKTYFAQPGDTAVTLKRKREARMNLLESVLKESGKAAEGFEDELVQPKKSLTTPKTGTPKYDINGNRIN
jgi:hypothetical protein